MRTANCFILLLVGFFAFLSPLIAQQKTPTFEIPDSCLALKDTLRITDQHDFDDGMILPWNDDGKNVWIWTVGNRYILVYHATRVERPPLYILGVFVKHIAIKEYSSTFAYVRVREGCKNIRTRVLDELKRAHFGRKVYWD